MIEMQRLRATVGAIIHKKGTVLLVKRGTKPFKDYWAIPGGHIDFGETAEQAVIRETKEETGLEIKPIFFRYFDEIIDDYDWHSVVLMFSCSFSGEIKAEKLLDTTLTDAEGVKRTEEITDLKWFSYGEIKDLKMAFRHREILDEWIKKKPIS